MRLARWEAWPDREVSWCREQSRVEPPFFPTASLDGDEDAVHIPAFPGHPRPFPLRKSRDERRVFTIGSSAAHGYGFSRNGSFSGHLERILAETHPRWDVQVINAGAIAWSSQQHLQVAKDAIRWHQPDLLLVYAGNNELLEWWDWRQFLPARTCRLFLWTLRADRSLGTLRSWLWFRRVVLQADLHAWGQTRYTDDDALPWNQRARLDDSARRWAVESWRYNIGRVLDEAALAGIPVVLSTVAANHADPPGQFPFGGDEPPRVQDLLDLADQDLAAGNPSAAEDRFEEAWDLWPEAITHWRWGDLFRRWKHPDRALPHLREAIRRDENPHRVLPEVNDAIRAMARARHVPLVDAEATLAATSADGIVGFEQVYDHCHPTLQSHAVLARAFAERIFADVWPAETPIDLDGWLRETQADLDARTVDRDRIESWLGVRLERGTTDYLRDPEAQGQDLWRTTRDKARYLEHDAGAWNRAGVVAWHSIHADAWRDRASSVQEALDALRKAVALDPGLCDAHANLGRALSEVGRLEDALPELEAALACNPADEPTRILWAGVERRLASRNAGAGR